MRRNQPPSAAGAIHSLSRTRMRPSELLDKDLRAVYEYLSELGITRDQSATRKFFPASHRGRATRAADARRLCCARPLYCGWRLLPLWLSSIFATFVGSQPHFPNRNMTTRSLELGSHREHFRRIAQKFESQNPFVQNIPNFRRSKFPTPCGLYCQVGEIFTRSS